MFSKGRESGYTKLILAGLAFSLIVLAASAFIADDTEAVEPEPVEDGDIAYMIDTENHTAAVKGLSASGASKNSIVIPESFWYVSATYDVTSMNDEAFKDKTNLTSVQILGDTPISTKAFSGCSSLISVQLQYNAIVPPDSFEGCTSLNSVIFFGAATNYTEAINKFPNTINSVAFYSQSSVNIESIASLNHITIIGIIDSSKSHEMGNLVFKNSSGTVIENALDLNGKVFSANTRTEWIQIATILPSDSNVIYEVNRTNMTASVIGLEFTNATTAIIDEYYVSEGALFEVTSIKQFKNYTSLVSVTIPNSVTSINSSAFSGCTGLTSITLPNQLTTVNPGTFHGCSGLISVTVPDSVTSIEGGAFTLCTALTTINLPDNITYIGNGAFQKCSSLSSITLPDGLVTLDECSFLGSGLTSVTIPGNVATFGAAAFSDCSSLTNIFVDDANLNFKDVNGVVYSADGTSLVQYPCGRTGSFVIPDGVTAVDSNAFSWSNVSSVTIPDGVALLDSYAFAYCASLSSVVMPDDINSIHGTAFTLDNPSYLMIRGDASSTVTDYSSIFLRISATTLVIDSPAAVDLTKIIGVGTVTEFFLTENSTATTGLTLRTGGSEITDPAERAVKSYTTTDAGRTIWDAVATTAIPKAAVGLVYNGSLQTGVPFSTNYFIITNNQGTYPGTYTATARLKEGLYWSDGTDSNKTVTWTMAKATLTAVYAGETIEFGTSPELNVAVTGFVGGETALTAGGYTAPTITGAGTAVGTYTLTPSGGAADNYDFTYTAGTLTITEAEEPDDGGSDQNGDGILLYAGIGIAAAAVIAALSLVFLRRR